MTDTRFDSKFVKVSPGEVLLYRFSGELWCLSEFSEGTLHFCQLDCKILGWGEFEEMSLLAESLGFEPRIVEQELSPFAICSDGGFRVSRDFG
jgi:hypothetical protein